MRQGQNSKRSRGRGSGRRSNVPARHQTFDSNGPSVRIRGSAYQVHEKYLALARDASSSGDRIMAENYLQHAEHYFRIINADSEGDSRGRSSGQRPERQQQNDQPSANEENADSAVVEKVALQAANGHDAGESAEDGEKQPAAAFANGEDRKSVDDSAGDEAPAPKKSRAPRAPRGRPRAARKAAPSDGEDAQPAQPEE